MKKLLQILGLLSTVALLTLAQNARAVQVGGDISISGGLVPVSESGSLADATGIDFLEWDGSAFVSGTSGGSFIVTGASGDFADFVTPSPFILGNINDFAFTDPFAPVEPLWSIGGFSFDLLSVSVLEQTSTTLILSGYGQVYGNGFENTDGSWLLTANSLGTTFSWSASTDVPEAASLVLLALGLLGLGLYRRR